MDVRLCARFFDGNDARSTIDCLDLTERLVSAGQIDVVSFPHFSFLMRIRILIYRTLRGTPAACNEGEAGNGGSLIKELIVRQISKAEEFPPRPFRFAAMPVQQVSQQPARLLIFGARLSIERHFVSEDRNQGLHP